MISVVIPLYNKEKSIVRTLESVLAQTYWTKGRDCKMARGEVVIVNDGSTDQSAQVVRDWLEDKGLRTEEKRCYFRLVNKENGGVSSARNRGIQEATGEYVVFLDGDDIWHKSFLSELHLLITSFTQAAIYGIGCQEVNEGDALEDTESNPVIKLFDNGDWFSSGKYFTGSSTCIRKEIFDRIGYFDEKLTHGEDLDMWWRILLKYPGAFSSRVLAYYRQDAENRAMDRLIPLENHIPIYINRYQAARQTNVEFRRFFDTQMVYRLYPYLFDDKYKDEVSALAKDLDYSLLKKSMRFRMNHPYLYRIYEKLRGR